MEQKRCIFHIPNHIDIEGLSGSSLRPRMMIRGFEENGYYVDCIMGYGNERKKQIKRIKYNIKSGMKYDFLYSESSTMPTLLTEENHFPKYPFLDFEFFQFCKKNGLKIGLFYRDIQWKFDVYKKNVSIIKKMLSIPMYRYDLFKYTKLVDKFYLPSSSMKNYIQEYPNLIRKTSVLMPGCTNNIKDKPSISKNQKLNIFYVGGIHRIYDLTVFMESIKNNTDIIATICCREKEWNLCKDMYINLLGDNISIIHESGEKLEKYYQNADVCCLFTGVNKYMKMAMPIKLFEYLTHAVPILATKGTTAGEFIENMGIGWSIEYDVKSLKNFFDYLLCNKHDLYQIQEKEIKVAYDHTWSQRAKRVIEDLL